MLKQVKRSPIMAGQWKQKPLEKTGGFRKARRVGKTTIKDFKNEK